jgi:hypothetical protein
MGWKSIKNGELLQLAEARFDLFLTSDQNLRYQQNLAGRRIAIIELSTNKLRRVQAAAEALQQAIVSIKQADFLRLDIP